MGMQWRSHQFWGEVLLAIGLAIGSAFLATISPFDHLGGISLALIVGMLTKAFFLKRSSQAGGLGFSAKTLLRVGIVLLGTRLTAANPRPNLSPGTSPDFWLPMCSLP
jgi:uncharacterized membrane protein YadS